MAFICTVASAPSVAPCKHGAGIIIVNNNTGYVQLIIFYIITIIIFPNVTLALNESVMFVC